MTTYTDVFGGANIYPSEISYSAISLVADISLFWPEETSAATDLATRIIDVTAINGFAITLPFANKTGTGQTILFSNVGASAFLVKDADGIQVVSIDPGTTWQIYLTDNSTEAGIWEAFQFGASISAANASALAGTGIVAVGTLLSQSVPVSSFNSDYIAGMNDRARFLLWTGASGTLTLPVPSAVGNNWFLYLRNAGSGAISVDPSGPSSIDGSASLSFQPGESAIIATDGTAYYTIGFGQSAAFAFDYTSIDVAGTGNYVLSGTELNRVAYSFTGVLTGNRNIIVPATVQQYWASNLTSGSFTLTVKTLAGLGITIPPGSRSILYCNGTDVVRAETGGLATPISVLDGGTGSSTAGGALVNLGATSVGIALFTAASQAAAYAALGDPPYMTAFGLNLVAAADGATAYGVLGKPPDGLIDGGSF